MKMLRGAILFLTFVVGIYYQPNWIYQAFYYNPRWVDDAWWSLSYPAYLIIYSLLTVGLVELALRFLYKTKNVKVEK